MTDESDAKKANGFPDIPVERLPRPERTWGLRITKPVLCSPWTDVAELSQADMLDLLTAQATAQATAASLQGHQPAS